MLCCLCGAVCSGAYEGEPSTHIWVPWFARGSIPDYVDRMVDIAHSLDRKLLYNSLINTYAFYGKLRLYTLIYIDLLYTPVPGISRYKRAVAGALER